MNTRNEAAASKEHFLNLCELLGVPSPNSDATGATYAFEKGVTKAAGGGGWADVWKRGCFGWEYKSRGADLNKAHDQLLRYAGALENPPLLVSSDMDRIVVRTNWTNAVSETNEFRLEDLRDVAVRQRLAAGSAEALAQRKAEEAEVQRLKRENKRLEEENLILRKAAAVFAKGIA